jgi:tetratricopeptide (TPR) repeat protein
MLTEIFVFVSSKMKELAPERQALHKLLPQLSTDLVKVRAWVFEDDAPAASKSIREVYLDALKRSGLYIGVFWNEYGEWTIDEFQRATEWSIDRHIYVKNVQAEQRDPRLQTFLDEQSNVVSGITPKWFTSVDDLCQQVRVSIEAWLQDRLARHPGQSSATLTEFSDDIPDLPARLVGRDAVLKQVQTLLEQGGRVLLQGFGGMGKSALAATLAAEWLDANKGRVLWLRAGSEDAATLAEALARPFDAYQTVANAAGEEKIKALRRLLSESAVSLLVLDDVWDGTALSQILKAAPRKLPVLVTARQRYALDQIVEIGKLAPEQALDLLNFYAGQNYSRDTTAREICRQLGYHAFALEVAGKTLKVDQIGPGELLRRIAAAPHAMAMPENFAEEGRTSITELLAASLYAVSDDVRRVFLAFGRLYTPQAAPELLARCLSGDEAQVNDALTTLQRRGLAEREAETDTSAAYYRVHDLAYSYAKAVTAEQGDTQPAVIAACRSYAEDHAGDVKALEADQNNLLGAAESAQVSGDHMALVAMMQTLAGPYLSARGHTLKFLQLLDAAIQSAAILGSDHAETRQFLLGKRGNAYFHRDILDKALQSYQDALQVAREIGRRERQTLLLCAVGKVLSKQGEASPAEAHFEQAYQIAEELDDNFLRGFVVEHQGYHAQSKKDYAAARDYFGKEVTLAEQLGDPETQFYALLNFASAEHELQQFADALTHHQEALEIAQRLGHRIWTAHALQSMGEDHFQLGHRAEAERCLLQAQAIFRESGMQAKEQEVEDYLKHAGLPTG